MVYTNKGTFCEDTDCKQEGAIKRLDDLVATDLDIEGASSNRCTVWKFGWTDNILVKEWYSENYCFILKSG